MFGDQGSAAEGVPVPFNLAILAVRRLLLAGRGAMAALAGMSDRAFTSVSGYLRPHPDPWLETALRRAFAEFDRDLSVILHHEQAPR
jgi:hypothetical protein